MIADNIWGGYVTGATNILSATLWNSDKALQNCGTVTTTAATSNSLSCSWVTASERLQHRPVWLYLCSVDLLHSVRWLRHHLTTPPRPARCTPLPAAKTKRGTMIGFGTLAKLAKGGLGPDEFAAICEAAGMEIEFAEVARPDYRAAFGQAGASLTQSGARLVSIDGKMKNGDTMRGLDCSGTCHRDM